MGMNCSTDVNECNNATVCQENSTCVNAPGSFVCKCNAGYYENVPGKCASRFFFRQKPSPLRNVLLHKFSTNTDFFFNFSK
jgi:hypothetical protein